MDDRVEVGKKHRRNAAWAKPPEGIPPQPSHYECPLCNYYVRRMWFQEDDNWGHFVYTCVRCGTELR